MSIPRASSPGPHRRSPGPAAEVHSITRAPEPLAHDQSRRMTRYLVQMGIRVACFVGAIVVDDWWRWVLVVAAVVLPYSAVLFANAGRDRVAYDSSPVDAPTPAALPPSAGGVAGPVPGPGAGRVVEHREDATGEPGARGGDDRDERTR